MKIDQVRRVFQQIPAKMGNLAERQFKEHFRVKGFIDEGLEPWDKRRRQGRGSLMIVSGALKRSIRRSSMTSTHVMIVAGDSMVRYARIHNEGGVTRPTVTEKMKKFAWAMHHRSASHGDKDMWKGIALTGKSKLEINIPQRKFMGKSATLDRNTIAMITAEINKAFQ